MVQSSFFSDTPNYATSYPTQNDSNTNPVDGNQTAPSSFYPDGGVYEQANPDAALNYATQAAASAASAASHDASSATHDTNSAASATAAAASAADAASHDSSAAGHDTSAAAHDASAGTHDTNSAASATAAASSASAASTSATNAANSATAANTSATNAANSATAASGSASAAATSATNSAASATAAANSAANAASAATTAANAAVAPLVGAIVFQGTWNASTNSPALASGTGTKGWLYKVSVAGSTAIDGISQWNVGDSIVFDGTTWDKIDGIATEVLSVAGRAGNVTLSVSDVANAVPEAPSDGNEYARKNGAWALAAGAVSIQDTAPTGLTNGSLWWNSSNGQLYVLYAGVWVAASTIASLPGTVQYDVMQALSAAQQTQARTNIGAAVSELQNVSFAVSASAGALTIALKDANGNDPTSTFLTFRNAAITASPNVPSVLQISGPQSLTIPATSTCGFSSNTAGRLWITGWNDGGTFRLGVFNATSLTASGANIYSLSESGIGSSLQVVAGGNAAGQHYTAGAAVTNKPFRILGYVEWNASGMTAGTWTTTNLNAIVTFGPGIKKPGDLIKSAYTHTGTASGGISTSSLAAFSGSPAATVTPDSAANPMRVKTYGTTQCSAAGSINLGLVRGSTLIGETETAYTETAAGGCPVYLQHWDLPNSASSVSYGVFGRSSSATATYPAGANTYNSPGAAFEIEEFMG